MQKGWLKILLVSRLIATEHCTCIGRLEKDVVQKNHLQLYDIVLSEMQLPAVSMSLKIILDLL